MCSNSACESHNKLLLYLLNNKGLLLPYIGEHSFCPSDTIRNNIQNSSRWTFETISATIYCNLPGNVPNNYYFGGFEFDLHKALDFAFRLIRNEKNVSFFSKTCTKTLFKHQPWIQVFSLSDFDENHSWVKISRSDDINSACRRQALIFDANLCPVLKWIYW